MGDEEINLLFGVNINLMIKGGKGIGIRREVGSVSIGVEAINGSFYNVMGLPVQKLYQELKHF